MALSFINKTIGVLPRFCSVCSITSARNFGTTPGTRVKLSGITLQDSGPVKFTQSGAYNLNPLMANMKRREETPWFQGPVVALSTACFLIYFTCLREENDMDLELSGKLYDRVDGLEKQNLINSIKFNEENGLDTRELKQRLQVILDEEARSEKS